MCTVGSLGDLFPVLALARALEERGQAVKLALEAEDTARATAMGLNAISFGPSRKQLTQEIGLTEAQIAQLVFRDPFALVNRLILPALAKYVEELEPWANEARAICGTFLSMAAPLAAERQGVPYIPLLLQPTLMRSCLAPPRVRGISPPMRPTQEGTWTHRLNRLWDGTIDTILRLRHNRRINAVRRELSLPPTRCVPLFEHHVAPELELALWDQNFAAKPSDARPSIQICGFPPPVTEQALPADMLDFLNAGEAPLVVTLGSAAHSLGGRGFWNQAVRLARHLGLRSVLLAGDQRTPQGDDIFTTDFAPHTPLFRRAAAIVHHGGIGTTAAALRSGAPQLIYPIGADQPDNADRIERLGLGARVRGRMDGRRTIRALEQAIAQNRAKRQAGFAMNGAQEGARLLLDHLR